MKVLITGKNGQLGSELQRSCPDNIEIQCFDSQTLDITDIAIVNEILIAFSPDIVINAAAYTAVDKAESDIEAAYSVNKTGASNLASACKAINAKLIHISTDFVFDGAKTTPYVSTDVTNPLGVYGASKLAGEQAVSLILGEQAIIVRTAWVYSQFGNNFVKTMLRLMAEKDQLGIVYDQVGTPTWAAGLANMLWALVQKSSDKVEETRDKIQVTSDKVEDARYKRQDSSDKVGAESKTLNQTTILNWTDAGVASWYDFAVAIQELAIEQGLLNKAIPISAIPASSYPTPAKRPAFSIIDKTEAEQLTGVKTVHWRTQLKSMLAEVKAEKVKVESDK
ncbi:dTDP-4-dehydrorhamnose reductase [Shewanella ulleungensis]|uniref:dTDP-4-dehydrorhamnose reductase n=1 Tax=Shewanella ulleungensis TaxID=2282699 RepID=A0ABQ2QMV2_9GAMM|nr:dTDP-4-dehydrorhamnose reductase [Shewanella ulleungensis]MCL1149857.1 dTDP-4-dehydrorhamnose reductase [Shewanella ulleungensis]GGP85109.1 NAD(P)-dependent oxidoreductase [Shewanella ulleungensis]